ncbi:hypothetical protein HMPREF0043_00185 [Actinobaculum sp. oral taxon 183 str. F0552]|nr:hypothetical protein HMPREF0043_00185 [Actinobaculum sp. oral taxon 183 str. F0552]
MMKSRGSSPHTRGAREGGEFVDRERRIIPAYAGSTKTSLTLQKPVPDHPRIRGEHSVYAETFRESSGSSPHTRGARHVQPPPVVGGRIIPAYAGSTAARRRGRIPGSDHPRIRGEHALIAVMAVTGSWIIPAYAGSTHLRRRRFRQSRDHPRIRGEHVDPITIGIGQWGSSPHTRGAHPGHAADKCDARIIPAYAGSTVGSSPDAGHAVDHPRIRGEHVWASLPRSISAGSSPHTRGALTNSHVGFPPGRIIPAYAGSTARSPCRYPSTADHPRIRGEHQRAPVCDLHQVGSSPHTRGARRPWFIDCRGWRIIPAYAGSTRGWASVGSG